MKAYRADIDGLRAIAVSAVVLYHAAPQLVPAGFVGVDIFFVISGFLIGGIVYSGAVGRTFSFASFYARRARRILPALLAVVLVSLIAGYFLLDAAAFKRLGAQSVAALVGASNIYFWQKQSYFAPAVEYEPMTMTWSLGVEEQFYLFFPFIVFAMLRLTRKWRVPLLAGIAVASFALSIHTLATSPTAAFYLLPQRAWELAAGVILAVLHAEGLPALRRLSANLAAGLGLALIAGSMFLFDASTPFPGWMALMPVFGTVLLIQAEASVFNRTILSSRPFVFVGLISYSWYLWHWPLMAYVRVVADDGLVQSGLLKAVVISFVFAVLSWRFIEQPFRNRKLPNAPVLLRYGAVLAAVLMVPLGVRVADGLPGRLPPAVIQAQQVQDDAFHGHGNCLATPQETTFRTDPFCLPESSRIAVFGDSHAEAASVGVTAFAQEQGDSVAHFTKASCPPFLGVAPGYARTAPEALACGRFQEAAARRIVSDPSINTVYLVGFWPAAADPDSRYWRYRDGRIGEGVTPRDAVRLGLSGMADYLTSQGKKVIVVNDVPIFRFDPMRHILSDGMPVRAWLRDVLGAGYQMKDGQLPLRHHIKAFDPIREIVADIARSRPDVGLVDIREQMCDREKCRYVVDGDPLYIDAHHLSPVGARLIDWRFRE